MKNWKEIALMAGVAFAVVYASNNDIPVLGDSIKKLANGGTGFLGL